MELFLLYLFTRIDSLFVLLLITTICFAGAALVVVLAGIDAWEEHKKKLRKLFKKLVIATAVLALITTMLPRQKDIALIVAGWGVLEVAKSETAGRLASKSVGVIEKALDEYLQKPAPKKEEEAK